jgi:hypothetical protein
VARQGLRCLPRYSCSGGHRRPPRGVGIDLAKRKEDLHPLNQENEERITKPARRAVEELGRLPIVVRKRAATVENGKVIECIPESGIDHTDLSIKCLHDVATRRQPREVVPTNSSREYEFDREPTEIDLRPRVLRFPRVVERDGRQRTGQGLAALLGTERSVDIQTTKPFVVWKPKTLGS